MENNYSLEKNWTGVSSIQSGPELFQKVFSILGQFTLAVELFD